MAQTKDIVLNSKTIFKIGVDETKKFTIRDLPIAQNEEWSEKVIDLFEELGNLDTDDFGKRETLEIAFRHNPRKFIDLAYEYCAEMANERDWIENNASPTQLFDIVKHIMERALPFLLRVRELTPGA